MVKLLTFFFFFYKLDDSTRAVSIRETLDEAQNGRITRPIGSLGYPERIYPPYEYRILARISKDKLFPEKIWMSWMVGPPRGTVPSRPWRTFEIASCRVDSLGRIIVKEESHARAFNTQHVSTTSTDEV